MLIDIFISSLLGLLSGLGIGGGSLLILWLTGLRGMDFRSARIINLFFFIPAASVVFISALKNRKITFTRILPAAFAGCVSACVFSSISAAWDISLIKKLYGVFLFVIGAKELCVKKQ